MILGAGYGGLRAALDLDRLVFSHGGLGGTKVTLIDRSPFHELIVELHEVAVGRRSASGARLPLAQLFSGRRVRLVTAEVTAINLPSRTIDAGGAAYPYDHLVIALGSVPADYGVSGLAEHALPLRTVADAVRIRGRLEHLISRAQGESDPVARDRLLAIVIGGAGFTGIELAGECADWLAHARRAGRIGPRHGSVTVVEATERILHGFGARLADTASEVLGRKGVRFELGSAISAVEPGAVRLESDVRLPASATLWTGGIRATPVASGLGLPRGKAGRLIVDRYLRSAGSDDVSVIGDSSVAAGAAQLGAPPPSAQLAIQQGRIVARNIANTALGRPLQPCRPEIAGEVISLGRWNAVATVGGAEFRGPAAALAKRAAAANYLRTLGGVALLDRARWLGEPRVRAVRRGPAVSKQ